jgi:hypothetical protein
LAASGVRFSSTFTPASIKAFAASRTAALISLVGVAAPSSSK